MHVNARKIALSGVLAAFAVVLIVLGSIFETSTLFLLAAAAFCVGIVVREWGGGLLTAQHFLRHVLCLV